MGDVTYGACCIDDFSAAALDADFLVHYGHSCLVPVDVTGLPCLYVFVDITIDLEHAAETIKLNFPPGARGARAGARGRLVPVPLPLPLPPGELGQCNSPHWAPAAAPAAGTQLVVAGTIQFASAIQLLRQQLAPLYPSLAIPKVRPLSPGEVLGCTAPVLAQHADALVFLADGRFHLEALMIANPRLPAYRYDPYGRHLTVEQYDHAGAAGAGGPWQRALAFGVCVWRGEGAACGLAGAGAAAGGRADGRRPAAAAGMKAARRKAVEAARGARRWAIVLGTLGRQGNPRILETLQQHMGERGITPVVVLLSETTPQKLALIGGVDAWVQVGRGARCCCCCCCCGAAARGGISGAASCGRRVDAVHSPHSGAPEQPTPCPPPPFSPPPRRLPAPQVACPRLSIDWGEGFRQPTLTPYEALVCLGAVPAWWEGCGEREEEEEEQRYPMDYYAKDGGAWSSSYHRK